MFPSVVLAASRVVSPTVDASAGQIQDVSQFCPYAATEANSRHDGFLAYACYLSMPRHAGVWRAAAA